MKESFIAFYSELQAELIDLVPRVTLAIAVIILFRFLGRLFDKFFVRWVLGRIGDTIVSRLIGDIIRWIVYLIGITLAVRILGFDDVFKGVLAGAGVSAIIIGFAFKDIAENFLAGLLLVVSRPFRIGDVVEIDSVTGTVKDMDLRNTHVRTSAGRDVYIPNSIVIKNKLVNFTRDGLIRSDFLLIVDPASDVSAVRNALLTILNSNQWVLQDPSYSVLLEEFTNSNVNVRVYFWNNTETLPDGVSPAVVKSILLQDSIERLLEMGIRLQPATMENTLFAGEGFKEVAEA